MWTKKEIPVEQPNTPPAEVTETPVGGENAAARHVRTDEKKAAANAAMAEEAMQKAAAKKQEETAPEEPAGTDTLTQALEQTQPRRRRTTSRGTRRGRYRMAALLGLVVLFFAIIGLGAALFLGVRLVLKATDHTDVMDELSVIAAPLTEYQPTAFESVEEADQTVLLRAAVFRITEAERIRQLREKTDTYSYEQDDYGRLIIPIKDVNESFATLFGADAVPKHQTIGEASGVAYTCEYDKVNARYYVPISVSSSLYETVADQIELQGGDTARIRIGYALSSKLSFDDRGNQLAPTPADIEYYQWYSFHKDGNRWIITAVTDA